MKGTSKVIMGATLVMVVSLAIVLGLILVLLAELYCSLLLCRRRQHKTNSNNSIVNTDLTTAPATMEATTASTEPSSHPQGPPLGSFLGVLRAPRSFLFPLISCKEEYNAEPKKQHCHLHQVLDIPNQEISNTSPSISFATSPQPTQQDPIQASTGPNSTVGAAEDHLIYISNPIYDNEANRASSSTGANTPFETPDTSPSRLEMEGSSNSSSGDDNDEVAQPTPSGSGPSSPTTPPLTPMKKLPKEACSVSLRDARSLGTSGSDSNTNNGNSSSSSGSPSTSPSW